MTLEERLETQRRKSEAVVVQPGIYLAQMKIEEVRLSDSKEPSEQEKQKRKQDGKPEWIPRKILSVTSTLVEIRKIDKSGEILEYCLDKKFFWSLVGGSYKDKKTNNFIPVMSITLKDVVEKIICNIELYKKFLKKVLVAKLLDESEFVYLTGYNSSDISEESYTTIQDDLQELFKNIDFFISIGQKAITKLDEGEIKDFLFTEPYKTFSAEKDKNGEYHIPRVDVSKLVKDERTPARIAQCSFEELMKRYNRISVERKDYEDDLKTGVIYKADALYGSSLGSSKEEATTDDLPF